ncbi:MAG: hypothetical protein AAB316_19130, partial [Bacteroidota bacterium]
CSAFFGDHLSESLELSERFALVNFMEYKHLHDELNGYRPTLAQAADLIIDQNVSNYPIFVVHQITVDIGINIVDRQPVEGSWSVNASTLEEFVAKQIIAPEKLDDFKTLYKSHGADLCLFVLSELGAKFIFLPR